MHKIDTAGAVAGAFVDKDPVSSIPGTIVDAAWLNAIQEELAAVITAAGMSLVKGQNDQLLGATRIAGVISAAWYGDLTVSEAAANAVFNSALTAIGSAGIIINPKGSLVNLESITIPNGVMVIDAAGERIILSNTSLMKSAVGGHLLIRDARGDTGTRVHQEPNGHVVGTASKYDLMFDPYDEDGVNYRILNFYTKNYDGGDASTTQGNNGVAVFGVKGVGNNFGIFPALHVGFSDDGAAGAVPMKLYYFDTSDTAWRTPMLGAWRAGAAVTIGDYMLASNKLYQSATTGTTGATVPSHAAGTVSDGGVSWTFIRDFAAASGSIKSCVVIGDRDDLPKFGHPDVRMQIAGGVAVWNGKKFSFLDSAGAVAWNVYCYGLTDDLYIENAAGTKRFRFDATGEFVQLTGLARLSSSVAAADGDTTPSIKGCETLIFNNTGPTSVTQLDDGLPFQIFHIHSANSQTTLVNGANLILNGGVNRLLTANDVLMFQTNSTGTIAKQVVP